MPFKRGRVYYVQSRNLPGYGKFAETSTYVCTKSIAQQMEDLLPRIAERGLLDSSWHDLLDALRSGRPGRPAELTLPELLKAHNEKRLDDVRLMLREPLLSDAVAEYRKTGLDYQTENGLRLLEEMVRREFGKRARFGVLKIGKNITVLCTRAKREGGRNRSPLSHNYVFRSLYNSSSKLIKFHLGNAERDRIFADVAYAAVDDERDVWLSAGQIGDLLAACEDWFRPVVLLAVSTGADRGPLRRLRVRDVQLVRVLDLFEQYRGVVYLRDSKTDARPRKVSIIDPVCRTLATLVAGKEPDDPVFYGPILDRYGRETRREPLTDSNVRHFFDKARIAAGLAHVRFKDLRHTWAVNADNAGLSLGEIKAGLGHRRQQTSLKYLKRQVTLDHEAALKVSSIMGLDALDETSSGTG